MSQNLTPPQPAQQELRDFLYVISHDFNAHLRHIREFTKILVEETDSPSDMQIEAAGHIQAAIHFTEAKLAGLLQLSRLNTEMEEAAEIDLNKFIARVCQHFASDLSADAVSINLNGVTTLRAQPKKLQLLFVNLVANAITATHPERPLKLQITAHKADEQVIINITDNGMGILPKQIEHASKLFQKLQAEAPISTYTIGSGVGLNLCEAIMKHHYSKLKLIPQTQGLNVQLCFPQE